MESVKLHDKVFESYISEAQIDQRVGELGAQIGDDFRDVDMLSIGVLNGAFVFAADLLRAIPYEVECSFVKMSSYVDTHSTGVVSELIGLGESLEGRHVLIIEDIVDTGSTLRKFMETLRGKNPASVRIASLLLKSEVFDNAFPVDYVGFDIPNHFVVGYGLDYNGLGRGLRSIYRIVEG